MMRSLDEIERLAETAKTAGGWEPDGSYRPLFPAGDTTREAEDRAYAEGVEAALLWVLGRTGSPLPR